MADVVNDGFVIDPNELENRMDGVSLIVPTHFLGFPADMKHICDIAHKHGAYILQDAFETINLLEPVHIKVLQFLRKHIIINV